MLLRDGDLANAIAGGWLVIEGYDPEMLQPSSVDVRLDRFFKTFEPDQVLDPRIAPRMQSHEVAEGEPFILHPRAVALASTLERITLGDDLAARVEGKSSIGRLLLAVHATAGFVDPGFQGHVTLELANLSELPIRLWPGMKIGQLCVFAMSGKADRPYGSEGVGRYQGQQRGPVASRAHLGFRTWPTSS
ncbi:dCTP deaminase [Actinoplanes sp. URMC 104]|uniref:dCTP deaminase n=1 Tax=Actinoplanes sp. URMC 104 TaxID=3423409 RepID=UPI003F1DBB11